MPGSEPINKFSNKPQSTLPKLAWPRPATNVSGTAWAISVPTNFTVGSNGYNKNKTTVLERADTTLKDNRIPPEGFTNQSSVYDTVKIIGSAFYDPDFNRFNASVDGSGRDIVHYHLPLGILQNSASIYARVYYKTLPPAWLQEMFSYSSAQIDSFKAMYQTADKRPILIASDSILNLTVLNPNNLAWAHYVTFYTPFA